MNIELPAKTPLAMHAGILIFVLIVATALYLSLRTDTPEIAANDIELQSVQLADIDIYTDVFGELVSAKQRLITAPAMGNVTQIFAFPGENVLPDTVIMTLSNPQLEQEVKLAQGILAEKKAQKQSLTFEQENEKLNVLGQIEDIKSELEKAKLEYSVHSQLREKGVASDIELLRSELAVKQHTQRLDFSLKKYEKFEALQTHKLEEMNIVLQQQIAATSSLEDQLSSMKIIAGMEGTLQSVDIELGENVQLGQALAKVGSQQNLIARLRLPRDLADQINLHAHVVIKTRKGEMEGEIQRIESVVSDGFVRADAIITGPLTANARPALGISAKVFIAHQPNSLFVKQTTGLRPNSQQSLFVLREDNILKKANVVFGPQTNKTLLVKSGLEEGDQIIGLFDPKYSELNRLHLSH